MEHLRHRARGLSPEFAVCWVDKHVFSDRAAVGSGHCSFPTALAISRIALQPTNLNP